MPAALRTYDELYGTSVGLWLHWVAYLGYLTWYLVNMIRVCLGPAGMRNRPTCVGG